MRRSSWILLSALVACTPAKDAPTPEVQRGEHTVRNGTRDPRTIDLTAGEQMAIGWMHLGGRPRANFCTGLIIHPRAVITARHCIDDSSTRADNTGFSVGDFYNPSATFDLDSMHAHPDVDAAVLILSQDAQQVLGDRLTIIPANTQSVRGWEGREVQAGGYGDTWGTNDDGLWFVDAWIESVWADSVNIRSPAYDGAPAGVCFGDSGSSLLYDTGDGVVSLAVLSGGDEVCGGGGDNMTRLDPIIDWINQKIAAAGGTVDPPESCGDVSYQGYCDGDTAVWCEDGEVRSFDCTERGEACGFINDEVGYSCSACGDVSFMGECRGDTAVWCAENQIQSVDCASEGLACDYVNDEIGWYCTEGGGPIDPPDDPCEGLTAAGECRGDLRVNCFEGQLREESCASHPGGYCAVRGGNAICEVPDTPDPEDAGVVADMYRPEPEADMYPPQPQVDAYQPQPQVDAGISGGGGSGGNIWGGGSGSNIDAGFPADDDDDEDGGLQAGCRFGLGGSAPTPLLLLGLLILGRRRRL